MIVLRWIFLTKTADNMNGISFDMPRACVGLGMIVLVPSSEGSVS